MYNKAVSPYYIKTQNTNTIYGNEIDKYCKKVYNKLYDTKCCNYNFTLKKDKMEEEKMTCEEVMETMKNSARVSLNRCETNKEQVAQLLAMFLSFFSHKYCGIKQRIEKRELLQEKSGVNPQETSKEFMRIVLLHAAYSFEANTMMSEKRDVTPILEKFIDEYVRQ